jgi:DNA-binding response OmpR family regulator
VINEQLSALNILIVEDDPVVVRVLTRWLVQEGCIVRSAGSAEEGILIANAERMDLIVTDLCLPGMSGFAAIGALKGARSVPVLVMTGHADDEFRKDAVCFGAVGLIEKPFEYEKLINFVRAANRQ